MALKLAAIVILPVSPSINVMLGSVQCVEKNYVPSADTKNTSGSRLKTTGD